jgi:hypothetical protein
MQLIGTDWRLENAKTKLKSSAISAMAAQRLSSWSALKGCVQKMLTIRQSIIGKLMTRKFQKRPELSSRATYSSDTSKKKSPGLDCHIPTPTSLWTFSCGKKQWIRFQAIDELVCPRYIEALMICNPRIPNLRRRSSYIKVLRVWGMGLDNARQTMKINIINHRRIYSLWQVYGYGKVFKMRCTACIY